MIPSKQVPLNDKNCQVYSADFDAIEHWNTRTWYLFISLQNRKFSKAFIRWFVEVCEQDSYRGIICVVDEPYIYNRQAELELDRLSPLEQVKLKKISQDDKNKVQNILKEKKPRYVSMCAWEQLSEATPDWMKTEINAAFAAQKRFYQETRQQVILAKNLVASDSRIDNFAKFLLCEMPVLFHAYYSGQGSVDVYPGANADLFWQIEAGLFSDELPCITEYIQASPKLIYIDAS